MTSLSHHMRQICRSAGWGWGLPGGVVYTSKGGGPVCAGAGGRVMAGVRATGPLLVPLPLNFHSMLPLECVIAAVMPLDTAAESDQAAKAHRSLVGFPRSRSSHFHQRK